MKMFWNRNRKPKWERDVERILNQPWKEEKMARRIAKKCLKKFEKGEL